jgi:hypothetical protein
MLRGERSARERRKIGRGTRSDRASRSVYPRLPAPFARPRPALRPIVCDRFAALTDNRRQLPDCVAATAHCRRNAFIGGHVAAAQHTVRGFSVRLYSVLAAALVATLASPLAAQAQGIPEGAAHGAYVGYNTAGPVGWVVRRGGRRHRWRR